MQQRTYIDELEGLVLNRQQYSRSKDDSSHFMPPLHDFVPPKVVNISKIESSVHTLVPESAENSAYQDELDLEEPAPKDTDRSDANLADSDEELNDAALPSLKQPTDPVKNQLL